MKTVAEETDTFIRSRMAEDLQKCSPSEQAMFHKIWPNGVPKSELEEAWKLVKRTLEPEF